MSSYRKMMEVEGVVELPKKVKLYLPICYWRCEGEVMDVVRVVNEIAGGSTFYEAVGSWFGPSGLETEPVRVVEFFYTPMSEAEAKRLIRAIANYLKKANQYSLALEVDGKMYYVETKNLEKVVMELFSSL